MPERKRLGTVRKMPNSEPTRKAMIQAEMERATVIWKTAPQPTQVGSVAEGGLLQEYPPVPVY
ncbi:Uncharacterised protein [Klebsiella pneumoniae]|nr:Uncharacterised protein [Klebsiella pneumoniae]